MSPGGARGGTGGPGPESVGDGDGGDPQAFLADLIGRVTDHQRIEVLTDHQVVKSEGFVGNFQEHSALAPDPTSG